MSWALAIHSTVQCTSQVQAQSASASAWQQSKVPDSGRQGFEAACISWHFPDLTNGDFQGTASANTPLTSSDRNLIAGYHGVGYHLNARNGRVFALHLQFGIWRANESWRVPELTITQAPEPVETSHSCCRGNISIIPHTHSLFRRLLGARTITQRVAHTHTHRQTSRTDCRLGNVHYICP